MEKRDIISKLDVKIYPSEDLNTVRIKCGVNLVWEDKGEGSAIFQCGKILFGLPKKIIPHQDLDAFVELAVHPVANLAAQFRRRSLT